MDKEVVELSEEDAIRMATLYEEVVPRLTEMAYIVARNLGLDPQSHAPVFERRGKERSMQNMAIEPDAHVRILSNAEGDSTGCYDYKKRAVVLCGRPCF